MTVTVPDAHVRKGVIQSPGSFQVQAPAGSGKTSLLVDWYLDCLTKVANPEEVVSLTFTNKAAAEMQVRIVSALKLGVPDVAPESDHQKATWELARKVLSRSAELGWDLLENPSRMRVMTFDKLCASLASQLPLLSGLGGSISIEEHPQLLYRQAIISLFEELESDDANPELTSALEKLMLFSSNRLESLIPILSSLLACRDQWSEILQVIDPLHMEEALSDYVDDRLQKADAVLSDFFKVDVLRALQAASVNEELSWGRNIAEWPGATTDAIEVWQALAGFLTTQSGTLIKRVTKANGFPAKEDYTVDMNALLKSLHDSAVLKGIEKALSDVAKLPSPDYPESMNDFREAISVALHYLTGHLQLVFSQNGTVDFIEISQRALEAIGAVGSEDMTPALEKLYYAISHLLVDEMQDTSQTQIRLLQRIVEGWMEDDGRTLFMVADPMQSIYLFRQAEVRLFLDLKQEEMLNGVPLNQASLTSNFRSDGGLVDWFNMAFSEIFPGTYDPYNGAVTFTPSDAVLPVESQGVRVHPQIGDMRSEEAAKVVELVQESLDHDLEGSVAILVRNRSHLLHIIPALTDAGIAYAAQNIDSITDSDHATDVISMIQALRHPMNRVAWVRFLRASFVGLSWADIHAMTTSVSSINTRASVEFALYSGALSEDGKIRVGRLIQSLSLLDNDPMAINNLPYKVERLWHALGGHQCVTTTQKDDIYTIFDKLRDHCPAGFLKDPKDFELSLGTLYAKAGAAKVELLTIHNAKGLEFDTVIIPGLGRQPRGQDKELFQFWRMPAGFVIAPNPGRGAANNDPGKRLYDAVASLRKEALENESLRLLYVGLTRAKKRLELLGHATAGKSGGAYPAAGSLLSHLWPVVEDEYLQASPQALPTSTAGYLPVMVPQIRRLPSAVSTAAPAASLVPEDERTYLPSEQAIKAEVESDDFNEVGRIEGIMYHALMEKICNHGHNFIDTRGAESVEASMVAGMSRMGMSLSQADRSAKYVRELAQKTLSCPNGQWIAKSRSGEENEYKLTGYLDSKWISAVIDRVFEEGGRLILVDYKTSGSGVSGSQALAFMQREAETYKRQMGLYSRLLREKYPNKIIEAYLYFPVLDEVYQVDTNGTEDAAA